MEKVAYILNSDVMLRCKAMKKEKVVKVGQET